MQEGQTVNGTVAGVPLESITGAVLKAAPHAILVADRGGRIRTINPSARTMFGCDNDIEDCSQISVILPSVIADGDGLRWLKDGVDAGAVALGVRHQISGKRMDGRAIPLIAVFSETAIGGEDLLTVFCVDLSDRAAVDRELEGLREELFHAGRIGLMAEMTTTLAHELAQPLAAAKNFLFAAGMAAERADGVDIGKVIDLSKRASAEIDRAAGIVSNLRQFIKKGQTQVGEFDISEVVYEAALLALTGDARTRIEPHFDLARGLAPIKMDKVQIQQVVVNLVRNAIDAIAEAGPGWNNRSLEIETRAADDAVLIRVRDHGPGLAPEVLDRMFQPFTTTKPHGMGLGLSISRRIVAAHGGTIQAENERDGGAVFQVRLPTGVVED
jgi:two-component system sensor kinase FixL